MAESMKHEVSILYTTNIVIMYYSSDILDMHSFSIFLNLHKFLIRTKICDKKFNI